MKLQQLRYALEVYQQDLNVSAAAEALFTSQPGVSKQIRLLEDELGVQIFVRQGKRLVAVTEPGRLVLETAERILRESRNIKKIGDDFSRQDAGQLIVAMSHTQACHVLPVAIQDFMARFSDVALTIHTAAPSAVCAMVAAGEADIGIATEVIDDYPELCHLPYAEWNRCVLVPQHHTLASCTTPLTLAQIAAYPLLTYDFAFDGQSEIARAFRVAGVDVPRVVLSSADTGVLKTYIRQGLGIGLMAAAAYDAAVDHDLCVLDAAHLFTPATTRVVLRRDRYLRGYMYDFISAIAPHLTREVVGQLLYEPVAEDYSI